MVDLGSAMNITDGTQVMWPQSGAAYKYKIETSNDNVNWNLKVDKTSNTSTNQVQNDVFLRSRPVCSNYRYRTAQAAARASFYDFKVLVEPTESGARQACK